jgi:hypothetical protein
VAVLDIALGLVERGAGDGRAHVLQPDAMGGERRRIGLDANREVLLTGHQYLRYARHGRDLLRQNRVGIVVDLVDRQVLGVDGIDQHGAVGRVHFAVGRRVGQVLGQQAAGGIDGGLYVGGRAVDVAAEIELKGDRGRAETTGRVHRREPGNSRELLLERCRD